MASPSQIHEIKYLLAGLRVLSRQDAPSMREEVEEAIRVMIEKFVKEKNLTFGLPQRDYKYKHVPSLVLRDLSVFKMLDVKKDTVRLTQSGVYASELLRNGNVQEVYDILATCHLDYFSEFRDFINIISKKEKRQIKVANPTASGLLEFTGPKGRPFPLDFVIKSLKEEVNQLESSDYFKESLQVILSELRNKLTQYDNLVLSIEERNKAYRIIENDLERFCVLFYFGPFIKTRPRYDVVRNRLSDLGLINVILRSKPWITEETVYSLAIPAANYKSQSFPSNDVKVLGNAFRIYMHWPKYETRKYQFADTLKNAISNADIGIGFADIPTVREMVCEKMLLPSPLFDSFLRKCLKEDYLTIDFAMAPEKVTATRLPMLIAPGKAYNLIRIRKEK